MARDYDPLKLASQLEQFETMITDFAPVVQAYYQALLDSGLPDEFARRLVGDWHATWWAAAIAKGLADEIHG